MTFHIEMLDHIAIRVSDLEKSATWYNKTLGLQRVQPAGWGDFPVFMECRNGSGLALFPEVYNPGNRLSKGDHFAFRVSKGAFYKAQERLKLQNLTFEFQDHIYFHSIYFHDPDGYKIELTTLVKSWDTK